MAEHYKRYKCTLRRRCISLMNAIFSLMFWLVCLVAWPALAEANDRAFVVAASQIIWGEGLVLKEVQCLTLNQKGNHIYGAVYQDEPRLLDILRAYFPQKDISSANPSCPYVLTFNIIATETRAVKYSGQTSRMLLSFSVVEKNSVTGSLYYEGQSFKGNYKNLYLFRSDLKPLEAFEVGLKAFIAVQTKAWEVSRVSLSET